MKGIDDDLCAVANLINWWGSCKLQLAESCRLLARSFCFVCCVVDGCQAIWILWHQLYTNYTHNSNNHPDQKDIYILLFVWLLLLLRLLLPWQVSLQQQQLQPSPHTLHARNRDFNFLYLFHSTPPTELMQLKLRSGFDLFPPRFLIFLCHFI